MRKFLIIIIALLSVMSLKAQSVYFDCMAGFNSIGFSDGHDFNFKFGTGYQCDSAFRAGLDFNYNPSAEVLRDVHTISDDLYDGTGMNLMFGPTISWSPLNTYYNERDWHWFDLHVFGGTGLDFYKFNGIENKYYGAYLKAGLEFDFCVPKHENVVFLFAADATAHNNSAFKTESNHYSPTFMQQNIFLGMRYHVSVPERKGITIENKVLVPRQNIEINTCCDKEENQDTIYIETVNFAPTKVLFRNDKFDLNNRSKKELNDVITAVKNNPDLKIQLVGMASKVGSKEHNQWLSEKRCDSVIDFLVSNGVNRDIITSRSLGDSESENVAGGSELDRCVIVEYK